MNIPSSASCYISWLPAPPHYPPVLTSPCTSSPLHVISPFKSSCTAAVTSACSSCCLPMQSQPRTQTYLPLLRHPTVGLLQISRKLDNLWHKLPIFLFHPHSFSLSVGFFLWISVGWKGKHQLVFFFLPHLTSLASRPHLSSWGHLFLVLFSVASCFLTSCY